jgi:tetratricopeptide (TPR) repeat protein
MSLNAIACYQKAISSDPDSHLAYNGLGNAYANLGNTNEAKKCYLKAISIAPEYEETYTNLANLLYEMGMFSEAETYLEKAIQINPDFAESYRLMSKLKKSDPQDLGFINKIESLREKQNVSDDELIQFDFALSKAYEDIAQYDKSFNFLDEGNRLRKNN